MATSPQVGFVVGALVSAAFNLADRVASRPLFTVSAFVSALLKAIIRVGYSNLTTIQAWVQPPT